MQIPETTSAEKLDRYSRGKTLVSARNDAWSEIKASIVALPPFADTSQVPSVSEPFLVWITSGEAEFQERQNNGPWHTTRVKKGSFFLTFGGAPLIAAGERSHLSHLNAYSCRSVCRFLTARLKKCLELTRKTHNCGTFRALGTQP